MAKVNVQQGTLKGGKAKNDNGFEYYEFLGVPYAKPPVGELRFKSPQAPEPWEGVRDVTVVNANNIGLQVDMLGGHVAGSEDCLYLNVYTPKLPEGNSELLPVMVFIHGGGFVFGNGILKDEQGPDFLIEHNTVVVTINYRLSVFGFLALDIPEAAGNMGLKDQRKALEWVQNNISQFSGDKNNVTIFGISAGGASVEYHIVSEKSKGLFHKAIQHSGSCLNHWSVNYEPKKLAYKLAEDLGYNGSPDDSFTLYEFLLKAPAKALAASAFKVSEIYTSDRLFFGFVPTIEKNFGNGEEFLTEQPYRLLKEGRFNRVPVIKGFCNKEGYLVSVMKPKAIPKLLAERNFTDHWSFDLDANDQRKYNRKLSQVYSEDLQPDDDHDKMAVDFFGDYDFVSGVWLSGKLTARHGVPLRVYEFSYDGKINYVKLLFGILRKGAAHADEHTYVLRHKLAREAYDHDLVVRNTMSKMWANFAKFSNPTPENDQEWPLSTEDNAVYLNFDKELILKKDYEPKKIDIFEEIYEKYENYLKKIATVSVEQGILKGGKSKNDNGFEYYEFLGVPYAKPPVGELRFKSPQTLEPWEGVKDVTVVNKNNMGLQVDMVEGQVAGSEDCLYLNVYTPKLPEGDSELLPVMVFIHGGGFVSGNGILKEEHGPEFLIEHNTVVVTINYRLSVFGFLALDIPEAAGNMGLKDQRKALEWVQNNISKFSGDKNNVTIFGISAGGASVEYHIVSEKSTGLFHKAIQHSGSCLNHWSVNYEPKKLAFKLAEDLGYNGSPDDSFALYEFLLKAPAKALTTSASKLTEIYTSDRLFFGFVPTIEKYFGNGEEFLTEQPYRLLKAGHFNRVPVIKGFCNKEGYLLNMVKPKAILNLLAKRNFTDHWSFDLDLHDQSEYNRKLNEVYSEDLQPDDDHDKMAVDFFGDYDFVSGIWLSGKLTARHGVPLRVYEFSYDGKINFFKLMYGILRKGAAHGDDHTYVLCHKIAREAFDQDLVVRNTMSKMWTNFAKFSNPTPENDQEWPLSKKDNAIYLNFDKRLRLKKDYESKKIDIFEEIYEKYEK